MADQAAVVLVPSKKKAWILLDGEKTRKLKNAGAVVAFLEKLKGTQTTVLGVMGGPAEELFVRGSRLGIPIARIPRHRLQKVTDIAPKASTEEVANAVLRAWDANGDTFYTTEPISTTMALVKELTRTRLGVQDFRKRAQLQLYGVLRRMRFILPPEAEEAIDAIERGLRDLFKKPELREEIEKKLCALEARVPPEERKIVLAVTRHFANPGFILGAKSDEVKLEGQITTLVKKFPIWRFLHPPASSVLPKVKGLGPALGGPLVAETYPISRFPKANALRSYARFHVAGDGKFPHREKGKPAPWNFWLNRVVWLWSTDQVPRYDHIWRLIYLCRKARELRAHPEVIPRTVRDRQGCERTVYDFTLKHLHSRAARGTGSDLLRYFFDLAQVVEAGQDPEAWYLASRWPDYFRQIEEEMVREGVAAYLEEEIPKRRRGEPKEEREDEEPSEE